MNQNYAEAKATRDLIAAEVQRTTIALRALSGGGPMGLTSDATKATSEWKAARQAFDAAFARLRRFNQHFTKDFAAKIRANRHH